jgi:hypothetical protein
MLTMRAGPWGNELKREGTTSPRGADLQLVHSVVREGILSFGDKIFLESFGNCSTEDRKRKRIS